MWLIYKQEARGREAPEGGLLIYKSATSRKGGVIGDLLAEQREKKVWYLQSPYGPTPTRLD